LEFHKKAESKLKKPPKKKKQAKENRIGKREVFKEEFDISKLDNVKISCEIDEFMKEEDILNNIKVY